MAEQTQTYYAKSVFSDPTAIAAAMLAIMQLPEAPALLLEYGMNPKLVNFLLAAAVLMARFFNAQRPVALIAPTQVKPVEVAKLKKTEQGTETPK